MKLRLIYIVYFFILIIAGYVYFIGFSRLIEFIELGGFSEYDFQGIINSIKHSKRLHASILISFPIIGVFVKNKYGWIFLTAYLYFVLCFLIFQTNESGLKSKEDYLFFSTLSVVIMILIIIMNLKNTIKNYYGTEKKNIIGINLISFSIGFYFSIIFYLESLPKYMV